MQRILLEVSHVAPVGWAVSLRRRPLVVHQTRDAALEAANAHARARHLATGEPTGVDVRYPDGEAFLVATHG